MTETLVSLISIFMGIIGANFIHFGKKKYSIGFTANTILGVFGSIFILKTFGRLGFNPQSIVQNDVLSNFLFCINCIVSFLSGAITVVVISKLKERIEKMSN